jgi:small subunit ribosomal protein S9
VEKENPLHKSIYWCVVSSVLAFQQHRSRKSQKERTVDDLGRAYGTGRRKSSVARVWIKEGSGFIIVNEKPLIDYFQYSQREHVLEPFGATATAGDFDVWCTVKGGGMSGQAGAVRLGISRALENFTPSLRPELSRGSCSSTPAVLVTTRKWICSGNAET